MDEHDIRNREMRDQAMRDQAMRDREIRDHNNMAVREVMSGTAVGVGLVAIVAVIAGLILITPGDRTTQTTNAPPSSDATTPPSSGTTGSAPRPSPSTPPR